MVPLIIVDTTARCPRGLAAGGGIGIGARRARRADAARGGAPGGVSHGAPTHHFGDLTGLVSELAAIGIRQFNAIMEAARATSNVPLEKSMAGAKAYVGYAQTHPGIYGLMFRTERLDMSRPSLCHAANASFAGLAHAVGASRHEQISETALSLEQAAAIARAWSLVHGFTMLLLDGRLSDILRLLPKGTGAESLLDAMLRVTAGRPPGT